MAEKTPRTPRVLTLKEFNEDTAGWMEVLHYTDQPALITRHGRFVALVDPIVDESKIISAAVNHMVETGALDLDPKGPTYSSEEVLDILRAQNQAPQSGQE